MKFVAAALAGLFAVSAQASTTPSKLINRRMSSKKLNKQKLMRNAVRYDKNKQRKLDGEQEEWQPTSDYSIQFSQCVSLKTADEDIFGEDLYDYTYAGKIVAQQSYVLFNVCETDSECAYHDDANLYMTPLGDYMDAVMEYNKQMLERKCEACEQTCNQEYDDEEEEAEEEEEEEGDEDEEDEEEDEDEEDRRLKRKLAKQARRKLANYIDCDECDDLNCEDEEDEGDDDGDEPKNAYEWLERLAECKETGSYFDTGDGLYAGFICNSAGDGVEIGVFLDEECSIYTSTQGYKNIMSDSESEFLYESKEIVINAFKEDISCVEVEYDDPNEEEDEDENEDEEDQVNEFCNKLFDDDTRSLNDCGDYEEQDDEEEEEYEEDENAVNYDWYTYDLSGEDAEDAYTVCKTIEAFEGEYTSVYVDDEEASGSLYDYHEGEKSSSSGGGGAKVFGIIILVAVVAVVIYFVAQSMNKKKDSKAEPLTKQGGAMA